MKFSKKWLQEYIVENLPQDKEIAEVISAKAFEVEEYFNVGEDTIFEIKILPNRAHDALSHYYFAKELASCFGFTVKDKKELFFKDFVIDTSVTPPLIEIENSKACSRFMSVRISGIKVEESPKYIKEKLEAIGEKSINNIVDITNYVQFTLNKPMHAYDAREIKNKIVVRFAKEGERLITLDDRELLLNDKTLVIADEEKVLGLAGIKGGKASGIREDTTEIILESANFNSTLIRKTSQKYDLKTSASKRFENALSDNLVEEGLLMTINEILKLYPEAKISKIVDTNDLKYASYYIGVSVDEVNNVLGSNFSKEEITGALKKYNFEYEIINPIEYIKNNYEKLIGKKYKNPSSMRLDAPEYFSCSSLVSYLYKGIWMPSLSVDKYVFCSKIKKEELEFGDLIFANSGEGVIRYESVEFMRGTKVEEGIDHVGIYVGDNKVLHATKLKGEVVLESLDEFAGGRKAVFYARLPYNLNDERIVVKIPDERLDLRIKEDLIEEIIRIIGFDKLKRNLPKTSSFGLINKKLYYQNIIRNILIEKGFSEVITYSFVEKGELSLIKAAINKNKLRNNLSDGLIEAFAKNINNASLLKLNKIKIFEFGNCFSKNREWTSFAICFDDGKKKTNFSEEIDFILSEIKNKLNLKTLNYEKKSIKPCVIEIDFDEMIQDLPENVENIYLNQDLNKREINYKPFSLMPFVVRDVAFWCNLNTDKNDILNLIKENINEFCIDVFLIDEFVKENRLSLCFRLIYQAFDRTLTDEEVNNYTEIIYNKLKEKGFEIR